MDKVKDQLTHLKDKIIDVAHKASDMVHVHSQKVPASSTNTPEPEASPDLELDESLKSRIIEAHKEQVVRDDQTSGGGGDMEKQNLQL